MQKRIIAMVAAALFAGQAHAFSFEAIGSFLAKFFKGAAGARGVERLATGDATKSGVVLQAAEPKPNLTTDVVAKSLEDAKTYKDLRASAGKGDAIAMMKMSEMTASGKVFDPGEPWHGYWMFQSARLGNQEAARKSQVECSAGRGRRTTDKWFDAACAAADGSILYIGDILPGGYSAHRPEFSANPIGQPGVKQ